VLAGAAILFPSLALLFRLVHGGALGGGKSASGRLASACPVAGIGFTTIADAAWAHTIGVFSLFAFIVVAFPAALPADLLPTPREPKAEKADA
jgi:cytochrome d ubiquinol oxidase subunit II